MHATGSRYQALGGIKSLRQRSDLGRRFPQRSLRRNRKITKDLHLMLLNQLLHVSWVIQAVKSWITRERTLVPDPLGVSSHLQRDRNQALLGEYADLHYLGRLGRGVLFRPPQIRELHTMRPREVYGFRVSLIVVSAYAKATYIPHQTHDFVSLLEFIKETMGYRR